jgi:hypothetical protein
MWRASAFLLLIQPLLARRSCVPGERYLYYTRDLRYCAGSEHMLWSRSCMAAEARYLNRTLLYDPRYCNVAVHTLARGEYMDNEPGELYWDALSNHLDIDAFEQLPAVSKDEWLMGCDRHALKNEADRENNPFEVRVPVSAPSDRLKHDARYASATVLVRADWPQNALWFKLCKGRLWDSPGPDPSANIARNQLIRQLKGLSLNLRANYFRPRSELRAIADRIVAALGGHKGFYAVHIRRGDKIAPPWNICFPNLDSDTQPGAIAAKLSQLGVRNGSLVYLFSDETTPRFFEKPPLTTQFRLRLAEGDELRRLMTGAEWSEHAIYATELLVSQQARRVFQTFPDITRDERFPTGCAARVQKGQAQGREGPDDTRLLGTYRSTAAPRAHA